eukprot:scaffold289715_cov47-Attheya_sp.AAC.2
MASTIKSLARTESNTEIGTCLRTNTLDRVRILLDDSFGEPVRNFTSSLTGSVPRNEVEMMILNRSHAVGHKRTRMQFRLSTIPKLGL